MEAKFDLFTRVTDRRDIVDFVKEVEKYPCLYDKTLPEYANKVHNRRAWSTIAKKANSSIPDCRDKWRKIRISFMRSLKQQQSDKPPMRPYYLTEELHFLKPFIKIRPRLLSESKEIKSKTSDTSSKTSDTQSKPSEMDVEVSPISKHEILSDSDISDCCDSDPLEERELHRIPVNDNTNNNTSVIKLANGVSEYGHNVRQNGCRNSYSDDIEGNPRKMFLLSMLPDVESLTEQEMRIFRREVINVVDNIINSRSIRK